MGKGAWLRVGIGSGGRRKGGGEAWPFGGESVGFAFVLWGIVFVELSGGGMCGGGCVSC